MEEKRPTSKQKTVDINGYIVVSSELKGDFKDDMTRGMYNNTIYDPDLNCLYSGCSSYGTSAEENIKQFIENNILFRPVNETDRYTLVDSLTFSNRLNEKEILNNALILNGMSKEYKILAKLCSKYDFLSVDINENGLTVCCSAYSEEDHQMVRRPWVELTPNNCSVLGNAGDLGLYFDDMGYDAFDILRSQIIEIIDKIGEAANMPKFERIPTLLTQMVDKETYTNCIGLAPSPDYDMVKAASEALHTVKGQENEHVHRKKHIETNIER